MKNDKLSWTEKIAVKMMFKKLKRIINKSKLNKIDKQKDEYRTKMIKAIMEINQYMVMEDDSGKELQYADFSVMSFDDLVITLEGALEEMRRVV